MKICICLMFYLHFKVDGNDSFSYIYHTKTISNIPCKMILTQSTYTLRIDIKNIRMCTTYIVDI